MKYKSEKEVKIKAAEFAEILKKSGIDSEIIDESVRDFCIKIAILKNGNDYGNLILYHKPSKNTFTLSTREIVDKGIAKQIETLFGNKQNSDLYKNVGYEIDIDGSYQDGITSYAVIIRKDGILIKELSGIVKKDDVKNSYQVAGELNAAKEAVKYCFKNKIDFVTIYYDMRGIEMWAKGLWKRNKDITKEFFEFMKKNTVIIEWVKLKSHTGHKWNEKADKLAKSVIEKYIKKRINRVTQIQIPL